MIRIGVAPARLGALFLLVFGACSEEGTDDPGSFTIGGTIAGLTGGGLVLRSPGLPDLSVPAGQTTFVFAAPAANYSTYVVAVATHPSGQGCMVRNGQGTVHGANVTNVEVECARGSWARTGDLSLARGFFASGLLPGGKVIVAGGQVSFGDPPTDGVEIWDPATGHWTEAASMGAARSGACEAVLASGRFLVVGGLGTDAPLNTAEIYDPAAGEWTPTAGDMSLARYLHRCARLPDGRVLVTGGTGEAGAAETAETYDPETDAFTPTGSMSTGRWFHTATLLPSGEVLVAGGCDGGGWGVGLPCDGSTDTAEVWDPETGEWTDTGPMPYSVMTHTASLLPDGRVLVAAGCAAYDPRPGGCGDAATDRRAALGGGAGTWTVTGSLARGHADHVALPLPGGDVLVVGGSTFSKSGILTERYDVASGEWGTGPPTLANHGNGLGAVRLEDGRWMVMAGADPYNTLAEILTY